MALDQSVDQRPSAEPAVGARGRWHALEPALIGAGVVLLSVVLHYLLATKLTAPWLMGDELRYAEMAKDFFDQGHLHFREAPSSFATAYPILISPAWAAGDMETTYELAKAINVVLMSCSAVVVFFWTRRLASTVYAVIAGGLVLLMPTFAYTGMLMTENAAIPAFLLAAYAIARALERPSLAWQLAVLGLIAFAALIRVQVVTLALVYPTAILLEALFARRAGARGVVASLRRFAASIAILVVGAVAYVAYKLVAGGSLAGGLGAYNSVAEVDYSVVDVARWSVWHAGELAFSVGVVPAIAFGVLLAAALSRGGLSPAADRAFVAVATAGTFWFVLQAAAFASRFSVRIEERYMVYAAPLLLVALAVWLGRALPRTGLAVYAAAVVPALLVMTIPFERLFNISLFADTFGLIPLMRFTSVVGGVDDVRIVLVGGLIVAVISFLFLSMRWARMLFPAGLALFFLLSAYTVYGAVEDQSTAAHASTGVADEDWIDDVVGKEGRVGFIYGPTVGVNPHLLWQTEFWNRSIDGVYPLDTAGGSSFSLDDLKVDSEGHLVPATGGAPVTEPYVLADPGLGIVGEVVAQPGPMALIRVDPPLRVGRSVSGLYPDGWSGPAAALTQFSLPGDARTMRVRVSRAGWTGQDVPSRVSIVAGPMRMTDAGPTLASTTATREWVVHSGLTRTFDLPVPSAPFRIEVKVSPTFAPSQFGQADARQLGAQIAFEAPSGSGG
ncbi:MAG TPA: glycosyltransferase family 39 protein [Gaiellaceae bacterium]